ncbi:hypothetical protein B4073_1147 [Bacillus subtilis]|nr:hypothetical protein B4073_1147 [Bacillus subtilis]
MNIADDIVSHAVSSLPIVLFIMKQSVVSHHKLLCANYRRIIF